MERFEKVDRIPSGTGFASSPQPPVELPDSPLPEVDQKLLRFELPSWGGETVCRVPIVAEMNAARQIARERSPQDVEVEFCRAIHELTLESWGEQKTLPSEEDIDTADDLAIVQFFSSYFNADLVQQAADHGFDELSDGSRAVTVTTGDYYVFRKQTRVDNRKTSAFKGSEIERTIVLAAATCTEFNGAKAEWALMQRNFRNMEVEDWFRITTTLNSFLVAPTTANRRAVSSSGVSNGQHEFRESGKV